MKIAFLIQLEVLLNIRFKSNSNNLIPLIPNHFLIRNSLPDFIWADLHKLTKHRLSKFQTIQTEYIIFLIAMTEYNQNSKHKYLILKRHVRKENILNKAAIKNFYLMIKYLN